MFFNQNFYYLQFINLLKFWKYSMNYELMNILYLYSIINNMYDEILTI